MSEELKPCPFCGKSDIGTYIDFHSPDRQFFGVICRWCGAELPPSSKTEEKAIERWNKRPYSKTNKEVVNEVM